MGGRKKSKTLPHDVYQAEESDAEEDKQINQRYDNVENFQYELPEDFEDEEIDEELAFTEEDRRKMAQIKQKPSDAEADDSEPDDLTRDDFSDDDSEADRLYGPAKNDSGPSLAQEKAASEPASDVDEIFAGISGSSGDEAKDEDASESGDEDLQTLQKAVQDTLGPITERKRRVRPQVQDEAVPESQFNLPAGGELGQLTLSDMLAELGPQKGPQARAYKQLAQLAKKARAVAPPLPGPIRARKERQAGYDETKKDITKWTPIVRVNREAPTLVFANPNNDVPKTSTTAALVAKFKPESKMEAEVAEMLKAAGAGNGQQVEEAEEALALQALSTEELASRREELAKMRSLLFRHEERAKHLSKIKSKDYHRRLKKSARVKAEKAGELDDSGFIRLQAEKAEYDRAKERLTLKHRNTSQWARRALKRGVDLHDDGKKEAIAEQLRLGRELRRKVERADKVEGSDEDPESSTGSSSSEDSEADDSTNPFQKGLSRKAAAKLQTAAADILEDDEDEEGSKGLFALPFMRRAQEKRKQAAEDEARQLLAELDEDATGMDDEATLGRRNFGLAGGVQANDADLDEELLDADGGSDVDEDAEAKLTRLREAAAEQSPLAEATPDAEDPVPKNRSKRGKLKRSRDSGIKQSGLEAEIQQRLTATTDGPQSIQPSTPDDFAVSSSPLLDRGLQLADQSKSAAPADVLHRTAVGQASLQARSQILTPHLNGKQNTRSSPGKSTATTPGIRGAVSIGPQFISETEPIVSISRVENASEGSQEEAAAAPFIRSDTFDGVKPGYYFGKGTQGQGYYASSKCLDPKQQSKKIRAKRRKLQEDNGFTAEKEAVDEAIAELVSGAPGGSAAGSEEPHSGLQLTQKELIAMAFAGDNVTADFEAEKEAEAENELPKLEAPSTLPGWGAWASSQREPEWLAAAKLKVEKQKQAARAGRKDAKLKAVSISERYVKKAAKYSSPALPYPYTSKEAFEGSIRQPLGSDFNSQHSFRDMTKPAIIKSSGVIIQPLKYSQGAAQEQKAVQKTKNGSRQASAKVSGGMAQPQRKRR